MKTIILKRKIIGQTSLFVSYLSNEINCTVGPKQNAYVS